MRSCEKSAKLEIDQWYMLALCLPVFMACIDVMAVSVAIASIMKSFSCSLGISHWILSGYTIGTASFLIIIGKIADLYGRRKVLVGGVGLFALTSLAVTISSGIYCLIFIRFLQGIASAIMMTTIMSIITHEFEPAYRPRIISIYGMSLGFGLASGPAIGGILIHYLNWQSIFFINVPISLMALWLIIYYIPESKNKDEKGSIGWSENIILTSLLLVAVTILSQGELSGWFSPFILIGYAIFIFLLATFLCIDKTNSIIDIALFAQPNYMSGTACGFLSYFCMYGWLCVIGIYLQNVLYFTALQAGLFCTPFSLAFAFSSKFLVFLFKKFSNKQIMQAGFALSSISFLWMTTISVSSNSLTMLIMFFMLGMGTISVNAPSMIAAMEYIPINKSGLASGLLFTIRWLGGTMGVIASSITYHISQSLTYSFLFLAAIAVLGLLLTLTLNFRVHSYAAN